MPFPRALELFEHWENTPPAVEMLHLLAAAFTDWQPKDTRPTSPDQVRQNVQQMGGSVQPIEALPAWMQMSLAAYRPETVN